MRSFTMDRISLSDHIAKLDADATEQEAIVKALEPYTSQGGMTTVGEIVDALHATDPARARWLLGWAQSLVARGSSIAITSGYSITFGHNDASMRTRNMRGSMFLPLMKMRSGTQARVTGSHSVYEEPAIADLRAGAVAEYLRASLPSSRTVTVKPHACTAACRETLDTLYMGRRVEVTIFTRAERLAVGPMRHKAQNTRWAHRDYAKLADAGPAQAAAKAPAPAPESKVSVYAADSAPEKQMARVLVLWDELQPYRESFKYDTIGTLVAGLDKDDPAKARGIIEQVQALIDTPETLPSLANLGSGTLRFVQQTTEMDGGQEDVLADILDAMNERNGETCVLICGWHQKNEEPALADRRGAHLLQYLKPRANANVRFKVPPHVCREPCTQERILRILRRVAHIVIRSQPRYVLLEDIRISATLTETFLAAERRRAHLLSKKELP